MVRIDTDPPSLEQDCAVGDYVALQSQAVIATAPSPAALHEKLAQTPGLGIEQVVVARIERLPSPAAVAAVRQQSDAIIRETIELEKQFPAPSEDELFADARWFRERWGKPEFEPYRGTYVAILNGSVVARGADELRLRLALARQLNVHPQRFIIEYVPPRAFG